MLDIHSGLFCQPQCTAYQNLVAYCLQLSHGLWACFALRMKPQQRLQSMTPAHCLRLPAHTQDCPQVCKCGYEIKHSPAECPGLCTRCLKYGHTTKDCR
jgi:hypothetical protein